VAYDFDPQYQRQAPHPGSVGALKFGAAGAVIDGVDDAAAVGTLSLPPSATISKQTRGSTAIILLVMVHLLGAHHSPIRVPGQGSAQVIFS
jgi:hypothetical protein